MKLDELKYRYIKYALMLNNNNKMQTARHLGISIRGLRNQLYKMDGLDYLKAQDDYKIEEIIKELDYFFKMPTNKERLDYINNPTYRGV